MVRKIVILSILYLFVWLSSAESIAGSSSHLMLASGDDDSMFDSTIDYNRHEKSRLHLPNANMRRNSGAAIEIDSAEVDSSLRPSRSRIRYKIGGVIMNAAQSAWNSATGIFRGRGRSSAANPDRSELESDDSSTIDTHSRKSNKEISVESDQGVTQSDDTGNSETDQAAATAAEKAAPKNNEGDMIVDDNDTADHSEDENTSSPPADEDPVIDNEEIKLDPPKPVKTPPKPKETPKPKPKPQQQQPRPAPKPKPEKPKAQPRSQPGSPQRRGGDARGRHEPEPGYFGPDEYFDDDDGIVEPSPQSRRPLPPRRPTPASWKNEPDPSVGDEYGRGGDDGDEPFEEGGRRPRGGGFGGAGGRRPPPTGRNPRKPSPPSSWKNEPDPSIGDEYGGGDEVPPPLKRPTPHRGGGAGRQNSPAGQPKQPSKGGGSGSGGGSLSAKRKEVLRRAKIWTDAAVPYSMYGTYVNPDATELKLLTIDGIQIGVSSKRDGYRRDCSGLVSWAWKLNKPGETTATMLTRRVAYRIQKDQLLPGDVLLRKGHVLMFAGWANAEKTFYWAHESAGGRIRRAIYRKVEYPYDRTTKDRSFKPYRLSVAPAN